MHRGKASRTAASPILLCCKILTGAHSCWKVPSSHSFNTRRAGKAFPALDNPAEAPAQLTFQA